MALLRKKDGTLNFAAMVARGENPNGVTMQTANGTAHARGEGYNQGSPWHQQADGTRWNGGESKDSFVPKPWGPNANRTGE